MQKEESDFIEHTPCDKCGSSDARAVYSDGHTYCFACTYYGQPEETKVVDFKPLGFLDGRHEPLLKRKLTQKTLEFWDYTVGTHNGQTTQIANYKTTQGQTVGQKIRMAGKQFSVRGSFKETGLYGQWLWRDRGKTVTVVEGELDALSLSQAFDHKWAVVSVKTGAAGAKKDIKNSISWLEGFDSVVFMFDNDEVGQKAALECAELLSPRKAKIAKLPLKDASDMVMAGRTKELIDCFWEAKEYQMDGIVNMADMWEELSSPTPDNSIPYPYTGINNKLGGIRLREIVTLCAGSGLGKSQFAREIAYNLIEKDCRLGYIALEESNRRTAHGLMGMYLNKLIHKEDVFNTIPKEDLRKAFDFITNNDKVFLFDHFGSTASDNLFIKMRNLVRGLDCQYIILDHISIVMSGMEVNDERKALDVLMTKLRSFAEEMNIGIITICHLRRPSGDKGHEDGLNTSLSHLRGSAAVAQLSDAVIGLERNQQDAENPHTTTVRVLKNRYSGDTGIACKLKYNTETGRMSEDHCSEF